MKKVYKLSLAAIAASLVVVGCGGGDPAGDGDVENNVPTKVTGQFVDTFVKGLNYTCTGWLDGVDNQPTGSGVTNAKGEFTCNDGNIVEFSIGKYVVGNIQAYVGFNAIVTPSDIQKSSGHAALNLAQLLQTIDDKSTDGALTIPANFAVLDDVKIALDDTDFDALMADALPGVAALVSEEVAQAHLDESLGYPPPAPALNDFVSGKQITISSEMGSMKAIFAEDGHYEEDFGDGMCFGNWTLINNTKIETTCADEGSTPTEEDKGTWEFLEELKNGMTVTITVSEGSLQATITAIETAVNPDN